MRFRGVVQINEGRLTGLFTSYLGT